MIPSKQLYTAMLQYIPNNGNVVSIDVQNDEENTPTKISIRATDLSYNSLIETIITEECIESRKVCDLHADK